MSNDRKFLEFGDEDRLDLRQRVQEIEGLLWGRFGDAKLGGSVADLDAVQRTLDEGLVTKGDARGLQSLGVVFGEVVARDLGFRWVVMEDQGGRTPVLRFHHSSIIITPLTLISKRVERGERVDCHLLLQGIRDKLKSMVTVIE